MKSEDINEDFFSNIIVRKLIIIFIFNVVEFLKLEE